ncbi:MAG: DUF1573 domain-containing protein [Bacteroidaceae bacterium]|nr:DUF1573 domain-containing protein [Bacteroidaceae bacterium]
MKQTISIMLLALFCANCFAQKDGKLADIEFDATTYDMGTFPADSAIVKCRFVYTNTGEVPLYIHQVFTSCGCTERSFSTAPTMPGKSDTIFVTYNGTNKSPGYVRKSITVHCNTKKEMVKLYIKGNMLPAKVTPVEQVEIEE